MTPDRHAEQLAAKYVWWKTPDEALADQTHFLAMLMTYGTLEDTRWLLSSYRPEVLRDALRQAPPGIFNGRSWHFWHLKLGVEPIGPLPKRRLPP